MMLVPEKSFQPSSMLAGKARSQPYSGAPERVGLRHLLANIRLWWKALPEKTL